MITLEHTITPSPEEMKFIIEGMRNPYNSWDKSDSEISDDIFFHLGYADADLMGRLAAAGTEHRKFMRMMTVYVRITAPLYWWKEFDTYKVGTVRNSCSTMHKLASRPLELNDFSVEYMTDRDISAMKEIIFALNKARESYNYKKVTADFLRMVELLPSSYKQTANIMTNYETLANIYRQRKNHKLNEWRVFCNWVECLPYHELLTEDQNESAET